MIFTVRLIGSLIKLFIYLCIVLIAAGAALFWFDTGSWLVLPLAQRAGNFFLAPMRLELADVKGSIHNGYSLEGLKLISGDEELLSLNHASVSPDWDLVLKGGEGIPYVKNLTLQGVSSDLEKVLAVVAHFTPPGTEKKTPTTKETSPLTINPFSLSVRDVNFGTEYANLSLDALTLDESGNVLIDTKIISQDNVFPLRTNAKITLTPIEIISSDWDIGQNGTGKISGTVDPLKASIYLTALSLDELLKFAPPMDIKASGRIDGRVFLDTADDAITASGVLSMPRANVMDIPLNFRLPFRWNGKNFAELDNASLNTKAASLRLNASADINSMSIKAQGTAQNVSLAEIGRMFAPDAGLKGEGGYLAFDVDTVASGDILGRTNADINAKLPEVEAAGIRIVRDLAAHVKLTPGTAPKIALDGQVFGGKLFARGEAPQDRNGNIKPQAVVSVVNLDLNTVAQAVPAARSARPSGKVTATARISDTLNVDGKITSDRISASGVTVNGLNANLNYDNAKSTAGGRITAGKVSSNGVTLSNLLADLGYNIRKNTADLQAFRANLGRGTITASGNVNLKDNTFSAEADAREIDTRAIPQLRDLSGRYRLSATASGKYTDLNSINATANFAGQNMAYAGTPIGSVLLPVTYANNRVNIPRAALNLPGGTVNLWGNADIKNTANPVLNLGVSTAGINIADVTRAYGLETPELPVSGMVRGNLNVKGPLRTANVNANLYAEGVKAGEIVNMPGAVLEFDGDMRKINVQRLDATINNAYLQGFGYMNIDQDNLMKSDYDVSLRLRRLNLKQLLNSLNVKLPLSGIIYVYTNLKGTIEQPGLDAKISTIEYNNEINFDEINVKVRAPEANHFLVNTSATIDTFRPEIDIDAKNNGGIWQYQVDARPIDVGTIMESRLVNLPGMVKGLATVSVRGNTMPNTPIRITAAANELNVIDKVKIQNLSLPVTYHQINNTITMKDGKATVSDGQITAGMNVDLNHSVWSGDVSVKHLNFGKLADPFMPMGQLVGKADLSAFMNGDFGVMPLSFANGKFSTTPGYLHKIDILDTVTPNGRIGFEEISGSFFWDGSDLVLNPGTGARAGYNEPLYRYFNISGPTGIMGKGLDLKCEGRFDLKILDQLLGAMKGVFQYMTGGLTQSVLREAASRILGVKRRDYQNVSFTLYDSWTSLQLLDLKITKSIEDIIPINILNQDEEKQKEEAQFKMSLKFPTGPGDKSIEEESTEDQLKQQFIDNLFNIGL